MLSSPLIIDTALISTTAPPKAKHLVAFPPVATIDIEATYRTTSRFPLALLISLHAPNPEIRKNALLSLSHVVPTWASTCYPAITDSPAGTTSFSLISSPTTPLTPCALNISRSRSTGSAAAAAKAAAYNRSRSKSMGQHHVLSVQDDSMLHEDPPPCSSHANRAMLHLHLSTLVRLALTCPYADVRFGLQQILESIQTQFLGIQLPLPIHPSPSYFIALPLLPPLPLTTDHETSIQPHHHHVGYGSVTDVRLAFEFVVNKSNGGRLPNYARVLGYFPRFLLKQYQTYHHLVSVMPGPLPPTWRFFIGILAAAQVRNIATAGLLRTDFLHIGGDIHWVTPHVGGVGLHLNSCVPRKLSALAPLNAILALQPWRLDPKTHFAPLILDHGWSVGELVHAIVILATVHAQCAVAFGTGIVPDVDTPGGAVYPVPAFPTSNELDPVASALNGYDPPAAVTLNHHHSLDADDSGADLQTYLKSPNQQLPLCFDAGSEPASSSALSSKYIAELEPYVSATEHSSTHQLISRLFEVSNASNHVDNYHPKEHGGRRTYFDRCEGTEVISDSEGDRDLVPPHMDHTYLRTIPPPMIPAVNGNYHLDLQLPPSISDWWTKPGTVAAIDSRDFSALKSMYTASPSQCDGISEHEDFDVKSPNYSVFRLTDWCWEDHGIELVSQYLGHEVGEYLEEEFGEARQMTMYSVCPLSLQDDDASTDSCGEDDEEPRQMKLAMGAKGIDTSPFREAIWYYVLRIFGQSMDDFNYAVVNHLLNKRTKAFIKKVATAPHSVTYMDWMRMGLVLRPDEKAHIVVLVAQARKQAELVWALSALVKYLDHGRR